MFLGKFNEKAQSYEHHATIQKQVAYNLFNFVQHKTKNLGLVLDLGSGNGFLNEFLENYTTVSLDIASNFLKLNKNNLRINADGLHLPFKKSVFNTVISSSAFHWITDFESLLDEISFVLDMGGILCFSVFLKGTFSEMEKISEMTGFGNVLDMKELSYYQTILAKHHYKIDFISEDKNTLFFDSVRRFLTSHKMTGASIPSKKTVGKMSYHNFIKYYNELFAIKNLIPVSYNVGYFVCEKIVF